MNFTSYRLALLGLAVWGLAAVPVHAQLTTPVFVDETTQPGAAVDYRFSGFSAENYPGYGTISPAKVWPAAIPSSGSPTASLNHVNAGDTTDFLSGASYGGGIYSFFSETVYKITQTAPTTGLSSLVFQLYEAAGVDTNATNNEYVGLPVLTLTLANASQVQVTAGAGTLLASVPATVFGMSTSLDDIGFTFDLSGVTQPIASYSFNWTVAQHSILYGVDVTEFAAAATPEPSTWALLALGAVGLAAWRGRRPAALSFRVG